MLSHFVFEKCENKTSDYHIHCCLLLFIFCIFVPGDHDDRVCPLHSYKYMAELQHTIGSRGGEKPLLIRIDKDSGHGGGKPTAKVSPSHGLGNVVRASRRSIGAGGGGGVVPNGEMYPRESACKFLGLKD